MAQLQESSLNLSLGSKVTSIPLNNVYTSPMKMNEPKAFYLFGTRIPVPSQDSSDITAKKTSEIELNVDQPITRFYENSMSLFSSSPVKKTDQNSKSHCSLDTESSKALSEDISLACKATSSLSPTKNNDSKAIYIFGTRIGESPQESYSLASTETSKRSRTKSLPKNPKEELKEHARKIKKIKKTKERNEENRVGVSMELDLNVPQCTITKTLFPSDINGLSRLLIDTSHAERHILRYMPEADQRRIQEGDGVKVKAYDEDKGTEHGLVFKRWNITSKSYLFNGGWRKEFVRRRDLKVGDKIGLLWDDVESRLHFWVLSRAPANHENPN